MTIKMTIATMIFLVGNFASANFSGLELTKPQEKIILDNLNNICGDSWCEGEYDLRFQTVRLEQKNNSPVYSIGLEARNSYEDGAAIIYLNCPVKDVQIVQEMVNPNGVRSMSYLEHKLYESVDECVLENLYNKK